MKSIVLFASGSGSNVENIFNYFNNTDQLTILAVYCNNKNAGVIERCNRLNITCRVFNREEWENNSIISEIQELSPTLVVLAGFLWKIPESLIQLFPQKIINIHPSLLPKFGGKGMYGEYVHQAVIAAKEVKSGITIHFVNSHYDEGQIIFQAECLISETDDANELAKKIHQLEFEHFPKIIEKLINHEI